MPDMHPSDRAPDTQGLGQAVEAVTDDAKNALDARLFERFDDKVSNAFISHFRPPEPFFQVQNESNDSQTTTIHI
jgi:hypothetical protein